MAQTAKMLEQLRRIAQLMMLPRVVDGQIDHARWKRLLLAVRETVLAEEISSSLEIEPVALDATVRWEELLHKIVNGTATDAENIEAEKLSLQLYKDDHQQTMAEEDVALIQGLQKAAEDYQQR